MRSSEMGPGMPWMLLTIFAGLLLTGPAPGQDLSLDKAERLALDDEPGVRKFAARASALDERSIAAAQLPDPVLKLGTAALPLDTFDLDQEPMTQLQVGLRQRIPPGRSRAIRASQLEAQSNAVGYQASDRRLKVLRDVRQDYLDVVYQQHVLGILESSRDTLQEAFEAARDGYAAGRGLQQDVYRAELERSRVEERISRSEEALNRAYARLAIWVGDEAYRVAGDGWPQIPAPVPAEQLNAGLPDHPGIQALSGQVQAAELGVDVARQQYKPGFTVDLTYGDRSGQNPDGSARADFLSAMLLVDLPVFREKRQDRELAARLHEVEAVAAGRQDVLRQMVRSVERDWATLESLQRQLKLYRDRLLPEASANSEAALSGYRSGVSDFTALMRAHLTEFDIALGQARVRADLLKAQARLIYLQGETP
ncbi:MAG: TolC family protein [Xanthomonadales bacterium]|nr:TolC family protein [Xanthomonadales bacterium]